MPRRFKQMCTKPLLIGFAELSARAAGCDGDLSFDYRLISPLFDFQGLVVRASRAPDATATAVRDIYGRRTATGTLTAGAGAGS